MLSDFHIVNDTFPVEGGNPTTLFSFVAQDCVYRPELLPQGLCLLINQSRTLIQEL